MGLYKLSFDFKRNFIFLLVVAGGLIIAFMMSRNQSLILSKDASNYAADQDFSRISDINLTNNIETFIDKNKSYNIVDSHQYVKIRNLRNQKTNVDTDFDNIKSEIKLGIAQVQGGKIKLDKQKKIFDDEKIKINNQTNTVLNYDKKENRKCNNRAELGSYITTTGDCAKRCTDKDNCIGFYYGKKGGNSDKHRYRCHLSSTCFDGNYVVDDEKAFDYYFKKNQQSGIPELSYFDVNKGRTCKERVEIGKSNDSTESCAKKCYKDPTCLSFSINSNPDFADTRCSLSKSCYSGNSKPNKDYNMYTKSNQGDSLPSLTSFNQHTNSTCNFANKLGESKETIDQCATLCKNNDKCVSFIHDKNNDKCFLTDNCYTNMGKVDDTKFDMYMKTISKTKPVSQHELSDGTESISVEGKVTNIATNGIYGSSVATYSEELKATPIDFLDIPKNISYKIQSLSHPNQCIGLDRIGSGIIPKLQDCHDNNYNQKFYYNHKDESIMIANPGDPFLCIDSDQNLNGPVKMANCKNNKDSLKWYYNKDSHRIRTRYYDDQCLVSNGPGGDITQLNCNDVDKPERAQWIIIPNNN
jgi:hypothetical protein